MTATSAQLSKRVVIARTKAEMLLCKAGFDPDEPRDVYGQWLGTGNKEKAKPGLVVGGQKYEDKFDQFITVLANLHASAKRKGHTEFASRVDSALYGPLKFKDGAERDKLLADLTAEGKTLGLSTSGLVPSGFKRHQEALATAHMEWAREQLRLRSTARERNVFSPGGESGDAPEPEEFRRASAFLGGGGPTGLGGAAAFTGDTKLKPKTRFELAQAEAANPGLRFLDAMFNRNRLGSSTKTWRGVSGDYAEKLSKLPLGSVITERGFVSTTPTDYSLADDYASPSKGVGVLMEIHIPRGNRAMHHDRIVRPDPDDYETSVEMVLGRNTKLRLRRKEKVDKNKWKLTFDALPEMKKSEGELTEEQIMKDLSKRLLITRTQAELLSKVWEEEKHPRGMGGRFADAVGGLAERVGRAIASSAANRVANARQAASTKITTAKAVVDWVKSTPADEVITRVAKSRTAKEAMTLAVQGLVSAVTHIQDPNTDEIVAHHVTNMADTLGVAKAQAAKQLKNVLGELRKLRAKHLAKSEDDLVLQALDDLLAALDSYDPGKEIGKSIAGMSIEEVIHDFVHSTNKRFRGKSREERIKMALAAWRAQNG